MRCHHGGSGEIFSPNEVSREHMGEVPYFLLISHQVVLRLVLEPVILLLSTFADRKELFQPSLPFVGDPQSTSSDASVSLTACTSTPLKSLLKGCIENERSDWRHFRKQAGSTAERTCWTGTFCFFLFIY